MAAQTGNLKIKPYPKEEDEDMKGQKQIFSTGKDDWGTPPALIEAIQNRFNVKFTIDAAAEAENSICPVYYSVLDNALSHEWGTSKDVVWCNPPYSECAEFVTHGLLQSRVAAWQVFMLIPARTDTAWWHENIMDCVSADVYFIKGRLKFVGAENSAPFPSALIHFCSDNNNRFLPLELSTKERGF